LDQRQVMENIKAFIEKKVFETHFIDTHEHLVDESERLGCMEPLFPCDDWTLLLNHYFGFDLIAAGIPKDQYDLLFSKQVNPVNKWKILEEYWPWIKNTTSGIVFRHTIRILYGIDELSEDNIPELQTRYEQTRKTGFYNYVIRDIANIKHCHVHSPVVACKNSESPDLLLHDIALNGLIQVAVKPYSVPENVTIHSLPDWHLLIDGWFSACYPAATGVKVGNAYFRRLDFERVEPGEVEEIFIRKINRQIIDPLEEKKLQDHLFWYCVDKATQYGLPVKMHTGQWAMNNVMNMHWVRDNPADCAALCRKSPETKFIFFHIGYPHYEEMISLAKSYANAYIDMCWSWSLNPLAAKDFLKKFILTVPNNKIFAFGGDDKIVENLTGHAFVARKGIALALTELVTENWITLGDALDLVEILMFKNAEQLFKR